MSSHREEMLKQQLAESNEAIRKYAELTGRIRAWLDWNRSAEARLDMIRHVLSEHDAKQTTEANGL